MVSGRHCHSVAEEARKSYGDWGIATPEKFMLCDSQEKLLTNVS